MGLCSKPTGIELDQEAAFSLVAHPQRWQWAPLSYKINLIHRKKTEQVKHCEYLNAPYYINIQTLGIIFPAEFRICFGGFELI